jgi:hypothetical protein
MSALQKSIRRGIEEIALRAATTLLQQSPDRLWRRLGIAAFEDISVADLDTAFLVTASLSGKKSRASIGSEWSVASYLVSRMARAPKRRAADDLLMAVEGHPAYEQAWLGLTYKPIRELVDIALGSAPLPIRALALWYAIGAHRRPSPNLRTRKGEPQAVFDALCETDLRHTLMEIAREGFRKTGAKRALRQSP